MERRQHWEAIYTAKADDAVSWYEAEPEMSLRMLAEAGLTPYSWVVDVGGGVSRLVDALVARGLGCITVVDIAGSALARARERLGSEAARVHWMAADVTGTGWAIPPVDLWHDRAVFHFLTDAADREGYVNSLRRTLKPGGSLVLATFAPDGPERCSGLPTVRYDSASVATVLGSGFALVDSVRQVHRTPGGALQPFQWSRFTRLG